MTPKNRGGRPMKYTDPVKLQADIDAYFNRCDQNTIKRQYAHSKGITVVETPTPYTMAGLAAALDVHRDTLNEYSRNEVFSDIIMRARDRVHQQNITLALTGCHDSRIAALNLASNYGYSTKSEITGKDGSPLVRHSEIPDDVREILQAGIDRLAEIAKRGGKSDAD